MNWGFPFRLSVKPLQSYFAPDSNIAPLYLAHWIFSAFFLPLTGVGGFLVWQTGLSVRIAAPDAG